ncbi:MAG: hypothetical protein ABL907_20415 [Hyphomicrobium sp.]
MLKLFFDQSGAVWPGCPPLLGDCSDSDAILRHGIVGIKRTPRGIVVHFNPRMAHPIAIGTAITELSSLGARRILVCVSTEAGNSIKIARCASEAIELIVKLHSHDRIAHARHLKRHRVTLDTLAEGATLGAAVRLFGELAPERRQQVIPAYANLNLESRFISIEAQREGQSLLVRDYGAGLAILDFKWRKHGRGLRIEDVPDTDYGRWAGDAYREAMCDHAPCLFENDVIVSSPNRARARVRYKLLILPTGDTHGHRRFLGLSQQTSVELLPP